jgi:ring-1,2-phenylacetyl-CoA epoxidase subunit PaaC
MGHQHRAEFAGPDLAALQTTWATNIAAIVKEATLELPQDGWMAGGGREGRHSEDFGYIIAELPRCNICSAAIRA